jgi:hypothetical protein
MRDMITIQRLASEYRLTFPSGSTQIVSRIDAARWLRLKGIGAAVEVTHLPFRLVTRQEEACAGCQARPALWEMDCDGPYATSQCGSEQCDWWACVETQQRQLVATCRNLSPIHDEFVAEGREHNCYAVVGA